MVGRQHGQNLDPTHHGHVGSRPQAQRQDRHHVVPPARCRPALFTPYGLSPCLLSDSLQGPSLRHPFGMDLFGCDYYTRTLHGARTSMLIGGTVIAGAMAIATLLGTVAAWSGGWMDQLISRGADVLFVIPIIFTALVLFGLTDERAVLQVIVVLTLFAWPPMVRLVRAAVRERLQEEHVVAAQALGDRGT